MFRSPINIILVFIFLYFSVNNIFSQTTFDNEYKNAWKKENGSLITELESLDEGLNSTILSAMKDVPRHYFLKPEYRNLAYENISIPDEAGNLIPSPSDCIKIIEMLSPSSSDRVLVAGNNCGYTACILSKLVSKVYLIEETDSVKEYPELYEKLNIINITVSNSRDISSFNNILAFDKIMIHGAVIGISENIIERLSIQGNITFVLSEPESFQQIISLRRSILGDSIICGGECYFPEIKKLKISN